MAGGNKPADVAQLTPVEQTGSADLGKITDDTDLTNAVVDNLYISCDTTNGDGYDKNEKAVVINTVVDEVMLENILSNIGNMDVIRNNFTGIILEIPAGEGTITIEANRVGDRAIAVQIEGDDFYQYFTNTEKQAIDIDYNVLKNALVFIFGIEYEVAPLSDAPRRMPSKVCRAVNSEKDNHINIYSASWDVKKIITDIDNIEVENSDSSKAIKVFRNGQILIIRNGKTYTPAGIEVK